MKHNEGTKASTSDPPKGLAPGEKWIDVNLKTQMLVAFEGDRPVFVTLVSTGKEDKDDPEKDHKTPTGTWTIREKHIAATMDGDVTSDGPYSIEDVPWIMYFNGSYALHGAFWHNSFGRTRSHGCVNLAPTDAKALFGWSEPQVPRGWHAVWSTPERPGTRVVVHE
jgi:lipoprotein-anchoring transpeptidase ErfK/SrfK